MQEEPSISDEDIEKASLVPLRYFDFAVRNRFPLLHEKECDEEIIAEIYRKVNDKADATVKWVFILVVLLCFSVFGSGLEFSFGGLKISANTRLAGVLGFAANSILLFEFLAAIKARYYESLLRYIVMTKYDVEDWEMKLLELLRDEFPLMSENEYHVNVSGMKASRAAFFTAMAYILLLIVLMYLGIMLYTNYHLIFIVNGGRALDVLSACTFLISIIMIVTVGIAADTRIWQHNQKLEDSVRYAFNEDGVQGAARRMDRNKEIIQRLFRA